MFHYYKNRVFLIFPVAPVCAEGGLGVFEAALGEEVFLPCRVLAFPSNVSFYWTFANTVTQVGIEYIYQIYRKM